MNDPHSGVSARPDTDPHADLAAYALDALDAPERAAFEAHLAGCSACQRELSGFTDAAAGLSAVTEVQPPAELRAGVLGAIARTPQPQPTAAEQQPEAPVQQDREPTVPAGMPRHADGGRTRVGRGRRVAQFALAAAVAIAVAFGGWATGRYQESQSVQADTAAQQELLRAEDTQIQQLPLEGGGSVTYVVSQQSDAGMLLLSGASDPGPGRMYQLWTVQQQPGADEPAPVADRSFSGSEGGPIWIEGDLASAVALAITIEPEGQSPERPSMDPFAPLQL